MGFKRYHVRGNITLGWDKQYIVEGQTFFKKLFGGVLIHHFVNRAVPFRQASFRKYFLKKAFFYYTRFAPICQVHFLGSKAKKISEYAVLRHKVYSYIDNFKKAIAKRKLLCYNLSCKYFYFVRRNYNETFSLRGYLHRKA